MVSNLPYNLLPQCAMKAVQVSYCEMVLEAESPAAALGPQSHEECKVEGERAEIDMKAAIHTTYAYRPPHALRNHSMPGACDSVATHRARREAV